MKNPFVPCAGGVLSADIAVPEHERELEFYSSILTTGAAPLWRDDLMNNQGTPIIGLGVRIPEYEALPLQWTPHFQVADVAASAAAAVELGGTEIMHGKAEDGSSQWAVLSDPFGAAVGLIPVVGEDSEYAKLTGNFGRISWLSLVTPDAKASREFYQRVIGWTAKPIDSEGHAGPEARFEMQLDSETAAAEICQAGSGSDGRPSVWLIHLPVGDLDESLRLVGNAGGR